MKTLILSLIAFSCTAPAFANVVTLRIGQSASCDNYQPGTVIVITGLGKQSAVTCGTGNRQPRTYYTCYVPMHGPNGVIESVPGNGATKREAVSNARLACNEARRRYNVALCQTDEGVIMSTCEERIED